MQIDIVRAGAIAGAVTACVTLAGAGFMALDWYIVRVIERESRVKAAQRLCDIDLEQVDEDKRRPIVEARSAMGGCS